MKKEAPMVITGFLVVRADGSMRTVTRRPSLRTDEVAFPLNVTIPRQWGRVQAQQIDVELPEPPQARVRVGDPEVGEDDEPACSNCGSTNLTKLKSLPPKERCNDCGETWEI